MSTPAAPPIPPRPAAKKERTWAPRMWIGMTLPAWLGMLARNRFAVSPQHWFKALTLTIACASNSVLRFVEWAVLGWKIRRTEVDPRPLIVLGHWRTGTTYLHELLGLDPQYTSPSTYQSLVPNHFLISKWWATKLFFFFMPARRPMDNMPMGWDRPQEDEFALCNLGEPSPYLTMAFPNRGPVFDEYLTMDVSPEAEERWRRTLYHFLQKVSVAHPQRIIIKSPPHTARVRTLLKMFPEARFVYIVRDPQVVFASTVNLWKRLYEGHGLQVPTFAGLEEYVLSTFVRMHERFEQDRGSIPAGRLYEVRYEDLVADPIGKLREMYERLELGDFESVRPAIEKYVAANADYQTNKFTLTPEQREAVAKRWSDYARRHGYEQ